MLFEFLFQGTVRNTADTHSMEEHEAASLMLEEHHDHEEDELHHPHEEEHMDIEPNRIEGVSASPSIDFWDHTPTKDEIWEVRRYFVVL